MIESVSPPEILVHGLVTPDDVEKLFKMCVMSGVSRARVRANDRFVYSYFERVNVHCDVLDPVLHTPASTFARCPFLFTVGECPHALLGPSAFH